MVRRVGWVRVAVTSALLVGVVSIVVGVSTANEACYVGGLVLLAVGLGVLVLRLRGTSRFPAAVVPVAALLVAVVVVVVGVEWPRHVLSRQFAGSGVAWRIDNPLVGGSPAGAPLLLGQAAVVLHGDDGWVMLSMKDGRVLHTFDGPALRPVVAADDRLLMIPRVPNESDIVMYDAAGNELWRRSGTTVLAYAQGVTVVETCTATSMDCYQTGYSDAGLRVWQRDSHSFNQPGRRIGTVQFWPSAWTDNPGQVLPAIATWSLAYADGPAASVPWQFADPATGKILRTVTAPDAGAVGSTMISSGADYRSGMAVFSLAWRDSTVPVVVREPRGSDDVLPLAIGPLVVLTNTLLPQPTAIDTGEHVPADQRNVVLPTADVAADGAGSLSGPVGFSVTGDATFSGGVVSGRSRATGRRWQFHTSTPKGELNVGAQAVVVTSALRRTTPLDKARGYQTGGDWSDVDLEITVLQLGTGRATAQLRLNQGSDIWTAGTGDGVALVADEHSIWLLGREPS